jgi:hypothetical protein
MVLGDNPERGTGVENKRPWRAGRFIIMPDAVRSADIPQQRVPHHQQARFSSLGRADAPVEFCCTPMMLLGIELP